MSFLRPEWFLLMLPVLLIAWWYWRHKRGSRSWASVVDAALLPHLLAEKRGGSSIWPLVLVLLVVTLAVTALAGPVWEKLAQPVFKQQSALVIALDLSESMNAADIKPSRLERARLKLTDLLQQRKEGQTALIAYAASPFTVTPLTDDFGTILSLLPSLTTELMPAQGSRADLAVSKGIELLDNAGLKRGDILLVTDGLNDVSLQNLQDRHMPGIRLSVLAVGTEEGAPVQRARGGFIKDRMGSIVVARTDFGQLAQLAQSKQGVFQVMSVDDTDINAVQGLVNSGAAMADHLQTEFEADQWREEGPWLLLLVTPLAALAFRRGFILMLLLSMVLLPMPQPVQAEVTWWDRLWKNQDQLGQQALQQGDAQSAAGLFENGEWKAAAQYRAGQYEQALQQLENVQSTDALYNRGNALAQLGKLQQALESYDEVLQQNPDHEDAAYNRQLVQQALEQAEQQQQSGENGQQQDKQQDKEQQQQEQSKDGDGKQDDQQQGEQQQDEQQGGDQQDQPQDQQQDGGQQQEQQGGLPEDTQGGKDPQDEQSPDQFSEQPEADKPDAADEEKQQTEVKQQAEDENEQQPGAEDKPAAPRTADSDQDMSEQAESQWLRRIPDDPGGLLRNKFRYQYSRQRSATQEKEPW